MPHPQTQPRLLSFHFSLVATVLYPFLVFSFFLKVPQLFLISTHLEMVLTRNTDSVCKILYLRDFIVLRTTSPPVVKILIFKRKCCLVWFYRKGIFKPWLGNLFLTLFLVLKFCLHLLHYWLHPRRSLHLSGA